MEYGIIENKDICSKCGGMCCKKSGCDYSAMQFDDLSYEGICKILSEGNISIVAVITSKKNLFGKIVPQGFFYLRARNTDRDVVDLVSLKTRCAMLKDDGCSYDYYHRPLGERNLVPGENMSCHSLLAPLDIVRSFEPHQKTLRRVIRDYTGMSVEEKLSQDVENLFYDIAVGNFNNVSATERRDIYHSLNDFCNLFYKEAVSARKRVQSSKNYVKESM